MSSSSSENREALRGRMWCCPACGAALQTAAGQLRCEQGHSFDRARQGYVNLLQAHRKRSKLPGDDRQMLESRRAFLERGYYRPLAERLAGLCSEILMQSDGDFSLLDTGCGEGYYTCAVADALAGAGRERRLWVGGIDIAKPAVSMAARRCATAEFAVASNASIPVAGAGMDCVLRVFAPGYDSETARVLKPGGRLVVVTPGARHLFALRERVYEQARAHRDDVVCPAGFQHLERIRLEFAIDVQHRDIGDLLRMTPYFWKASPEQQEKIAELERLNTEACFAIDLYRRVAPA